MLIKGLVLTALVASTPLALTVTQEPKPEAANSDRAAAAAADQHRLEADVRRANNDLIKARRELAAARGELEQLHTQLDHALDALDTNFEPQRDRNCSPSRSRSLMSHYQWLKKEGHEERAANALAKVVEQTGDDANRMNSAAWELMTNKETAGKFDEVALAFAQRMERKTDQLQHNQLDTAALAHFLNGDLGRAVELQKLAIARSDSEDYRRRLRTYEAAQEAVAKAANTTAPVTGPTMIASSTNDD